MYYFIKWLSYCHFLIMATLFIFILKSFCIWGLPDGSVVRDPPANAGDEGLIPRSAKSPGEGNVNPLHSSVLAWKIAWTKEPGRLQSMESQKSRTQLIDSVQFSCSVVSNSLRPHESQHTRPPCPSLPEFTQIHVHRFSDAIQPSHPRSSPSPPAPNPSQHQSLFQWVNSSHEVAKVLELQL